MLDRKGLIICIDSDRRRAEERRLLLEHSGYDVLVAANARTGLEFFSQCPADLALVDYRLPGVDGNVLAAQMKRAKPDVPVVFLAGHNSAAKDFSSADAVICEEEPWSIVLDKVNALAKASGPFFRHWLESWKSRGPAHPQDSPEAVPNKAGARTHLKNVS